MFEKREKRNVKINFSGVGKAWIRIRVDLALRIRNHWGSDTLISAWKPGFGIKVTLEVLSFNLIKALTNLVKELRCVYLNIYLT